MINECWDMQSQTGSNRTQVSQADLVGAQFVPGAFGSDYLGEGMVRQGFPISNAPMPIRASNSTILEQGEWAGGAGVSLVPSRPTPSMPPTPAQIYSDQTLMRPRPSAEFQQPIGFFDRLVGSANPAPRGQQQLQAPINPALLPQTLVQSPRVPSYNPYNPKASLAIAQETAKFQYAVERCVFVDSKYPISPMTVQPREGREFQEMKSISFSSLPSPFDGTDTVIGSFRVPYGFDGVLNRIICGFFNGTGFVDGSGDIIWRVRINSVFARNLGDIRFQYGSLQNAPFIIPGYGIKLVSGQTVTFLVDVPASSPIAGANSRLMLSGFGWYWPRK